MRLRYSWLDLVLYPLLVFVSIPIIWTIAKAVSRALAHSTGN